ncbi:MAG: tetratricopeptide repeat protein [Verrucomicrobia bacterium]|nr:tetratricopeptide repeat protein [Verrucomicrobiota bacterium]
MSFAVAPSITRWSLQLAGGMVVLATLAAYHDSFAGPFVFDDFASITNNPTIRHLWPPGGWLNPPAGAGVGGRPVANLSFALNYAISGSGVWSYHALNLLLHGANSLLLLGLVRHSLSLPALARRFGPAALQLATGGAVLWAIHPLHPASVTYLSQRTELLMALWYLLTLYGFLRGAAPGAPPAWLAVSVMACALGMATKEVMVTAPLVVLWFDRIFVAGTLRAAWRERRAYYLALAATWLLLALLMVGLSERGVGFGFQLKWWSYAGASCYALFTYLKLAVWPDPLVFDYGPNVVDGLAIAPFALAISVLLAGTVALVWLRPRAGFIAVWFFGLAAPASSVVPIVRQLVAENRAYLPLAATAIALVLGLHVLSGRRWLFPVLATGAALGLLTDRRNRTFRTELALWADTVAKRPANWRAHNCLAAALTQAGRLDEAITHYDASLRLRPDLAETEYNLGNTLLLAGKISDAIAIYEAAFQLEPWRADVPTNLGNALVQAGRPADARAYFEAALRAAPDLVAAHQGLANAWSGTGDFDRALVHYERALHLDPELADAHNGRGNALTHLGRSAEAQAALATALRLQPDFAEAHYNLGDAFALAARPDDAIPHYEAYLRRRPADPTAHHNLGTVLAQVGRIGEARARYEEALRLKPDYEDARSNLARLSPSTAKGN